MKQIVVYTILLMSLSITACAGGVARAQTPAPPVFEVEVFEAGDQVTIRNIEKKTVIEIASPFGIGSAKFTLTAGDMPDQAVVQLHVRGLEAFKLVSEQVTLWAEVPSSAGLASLSEKKVSGNSEQALRSFEAWWLDVRIVSEQSTIPLHDGFFEISLPALFLQQSGGVFEIHWVDFYR